MIEESAYPAVEEFLQAYYEIRAEIPHAFMEIACTRSTDYMAWICSNHRENDPNRVVLAKGQGEGPEEACRDALEQLKRRNETQS